MEPGAVAAPDGIVLERHRDLAGRDVYVWLRRGLLTLLAVPPALALFNVFGQRPETAEAEAPRAALKVYAPTRIRGGLYFEARFHVRARQDLKDARLVLSSGWAEGITINTVEPAPVGEASRNGSLAFDLGHVPARQSYVFYLQLQVNPTNIGHRRQDVELYDGETRLLSLARTVTVFP